jgi:MoaA/NifB/PqqE/SkfB family radical SAM enzyme
MAEPLRQVEVQLGHLCNNRCVFCVSGQLSEQKRAPQLPPEPIRKQLAAARANGATKITFPGGEPTLPRSFLGLLQFAVDLDFAEIVIFTNGTMTPRESFRQRTLGVLDGLGPEMKKRVIWRFSLQGGEEQAHDQTTLNPGAWARIYKSLEILHQEAFRLTGNMCVVESNYRTIVGLAELAQRFDFENLHLDMIRPRDSGDRTLAELRAMMSRYTDMAPYFLALSDRVDALRGGDFDLNFGNVPYCTSLGVAHRIHHDGQDTVTVAADGEGNTQTGFNKYEDKRVDKHKPESCQGCVFFDRCSGVFDTYRQFYGDAEFAAVTPDHLWQRDGAGHHLVLLGQQLLAPQVAAGKLQIVQVDEQAQELTVANAARTASTVVRRAGRRSHDLAKQAKVGWAQLHTQDLEFSLLGPLDNLPALQQLVQDVSAALCPEVTQVAVSQAQWAALPALWKAEEERRRGLQQRQQQARKSLIALVERLRSAPLGPWQAAGVRTSDDATGPGAALDWQSKLGELTLLVRIGAADGKPRLSLAEHALSADTVANFNQLLAQRLRPVANSTARPAVSSAAARTRASQSSQPS